MVSSVTKLGVEADVSLSQCCKNNKKYLIANNDEEKPFICNICDLGMLLGNNSCNDIIVDGHIDPVIGHNIHCNFDSSSVSKTLISITISMLPRWMFLSNLELRLLWQACHGKNRHLEKEN